MMRRAAPDTRTIPFLMKIAMKPLIRSSTLVACVFLLMLCGCRDKHEPLKPTVAASVAAPAF